MAPKKEIILTPKKKPAKHVIEMTPKPSKYPKTKRTRAC